MSQASEQSDSSEEPLTPDQPLEPCRCNSPALCNDVCSCLEGGAACTDQCRCTHRENEKPCRRVLLDTLFGPGHENVRMSPYFSDWQVKSRSQFPIDAQAHADAVYQIVSAALIEGRTIGGRRLGEDAISVAADWIDDLRLQGYKYDDFSGYSDWEDDDMENDVVEKKDVEKKNVEKKEVEKMEREKTLIQELLRMALGDQTDWYVSFCGEKEGVQEYKLAWHCSRCRQCIDWETWHCRYCDECISGVLRRCYNCGKRNEQYEDLKAHGEDFGSLAENWDDDYLEESDIDSDAYDSFGCPICMDSD